MDGNVARFRNSFRDMYDAAFPWVEDRRSKRDVEKPWLDDGEGGAVLQEN